MYSHRIVALLIGWVGVTSPLSGQERDTDADGLSDFAEIHKYGTDPERADSDQDGIDDGDWLERREYAYTVRSVVQVMKPVTIEYLNDDYQDARVLDEGDRYVELEVIHYPFNTVAETISGDPEWRRTSEELARWLEPGPTSDWNPDMRAALLAALTEDGVEVGKLTDREVVEQVSRWLMQRAEFHDSFTTFITSFDDEGRPYVSDELRPAVERGTAEGGMSLEEQWQRELSARGMFEQRVHGSCTSSSIYLSGCLRAVGIPTRTVLCIPLIDASDERERALVEDRLTHNEVRRIVNEAIAGSEQSWTSHTFNEVFVGGRWHRLNYSKLGQNILDPQFLGLMTHVATFHDWADAHMPETVGSRQSLPHGKDLFGGTNPYSTISLSDSFGPHCALENPEMPERRIKVGQLVWTDSDQLPADVYEGCQMRDRFGLIAVLPKLESSNALRSFLKNADLRVYLEANDQPTLGVRFDAGCWWYKQGTAYVYVPFGGAGRRGLREGIEYAARARNEVEGYSWALDLAVRR